MRKTLTKEQIELFKKYYLEDYSASLIFEKLGQPYTSHERTHVQARIRSYRIKLELPPRGIGHQPKYRKYPQPKTTEKERLEKRLTKIASMIQNASYKIKQWQKEMETIEREYYDGFVGRQPI